MTKKRKIILSVCIMAAVIFALAAVWLILSDAPVSTFDYSVNGDSITIDRYNGRRMLVRVPDTIDGLPVTEIGDSAFEDKKLVRWVTLPETTERIGEFAFSRTPLQSIDLPSRVQYIGAYAFGATSLKSISFPEGVTELSYGVLSTCYKLTHIDIPDSVTSIGDYAISSCYSLKRVTLPDSVTDIGDNAFFYSALEEVNIPASLERAGHRVFWGTKAEKAYFEDEYAVLNGHILYLYNGTAENVDIPGYIDYIAGGAFITNNSADVKAISIPDSVTFIGSATFRSCKNLEKIDLPADAVMDGYTAFDGCESLREIVLPENTDIGNYMFKGCTSLEKVTITGTPSSIGESAFEGCTSLREIQLPESVREIGKNAFAESGIVSISIPDGVDTISERCFCRCSDLTDISLPDSIHTISDRAFYECKQLSGVYIPKDIEGIGEYAFCETKITSAILPDTLTVLGRGAFDECTLLTEIRLPDSLDTVPTDCFHKCMSLKKVIIPKGYKTIEINAFWECTSLQAVVLPDGLEVIDLNAFADCDISSVFLPDSLTEFHNQAFIPITYGNSTQLCYTENCRAAEQIREAYQHWILYDYYYLQVIAEG